MNKTAIKNFAIWARNKLIADINYRAGLLGITTGGILSALPQSTGQTQFYDIGTAEPYSITGEQIHQRQHLVDLLYKKEKESDYKTAYKYVLEEVAYTWFNRLIAIRFMEVNDYLPSHIRVLSSESGKMEPDLVTTPFDSDIEFTRDEHQTILDLKNANKLDEVFRLLFIKQCNTLSEILPALFEKTSDYTELLLNLSVIDQDGIIWHLVHDIPESDFNVEEGGQVEIIGWLYQYYNTEPKNEAFAKKGKITKEEVPAVTQLFTPDWIVRYMVENSLGRLWVEGHPNEDLKTGWKYYLEEAEQEPEVAAKLVETKKEYAKLTPEDIKVIDPCMGSGHILVYAFDVFMQIYESAGYGQRDAARSILEKNIYGLDIDDRAFQMAYFAVMMKARQYNRRILNGEYRPNVYSIQESNGINRNQLKYFGKGMNVLEKNNAIKQMKGLLDTFIDAKEYGSILNVDSCDWDLLMQFVENIDEPEQIGLEMEGIEETQKQLIQCVRQGKLLGQKYEITTTNPPYMSVSSGSDKLIDFVKKHYTNSRNDLYAVFMERCAKMMLPNAFQAMITQHSWMFLGSYEKLRKTFQYMTIINMAHLGARAFDEISGEVVQTTSFILTKKHIKDYCGTYCRLVDSKSEQGKSELFLTGTMRFISKQDHFALIPGSPVAYWISDHMRNCFVGRGSLGNRYVFREGIHTADNNRFLRLWEEVNYRKIVFNAESYSDIDANGRYVPYNKGGAYRRWFGNNDYVIMFDARARNEMSMLKGHVRPSQGLYFKEGGTWSSVCPGSFSIRYYPKGFLFDAGGQVVVGNSVVRCISFLNTNLFSKIANITMPTINYKCGIITNLPDLCIDTEHVNRLGEKCIDLCKIDWDSFETSWDFQSHPLVKRGLGRFDRNIESLSIEECYQAWAKECDERFDQLKANEEELNSIFIDTYDLQGELTPTVDEKDVTVRRANLLREIKSLLSYAVGCMFGRYSLSTFGLVYAGGEWKDSKYGQFKPDNDNIIPISDEEYLEDDIVSRLCTFLKIAFGDQTLEKNLDFIATSLNGKGKTSRETIRNYFINDFFRDHCQTYSVTGSGKRPIYWLFDSGKQNGFKALIYLHRYNADTIGNLRIDYLHRMQRVYEHEINRMQDLIDYSTSSREAAQAAKHREKLIKQLKECREYDEKLAHLALSRIELDLDDGVKVNYRKIQTANDGKFYEVLADSKSIMGKTK